MTIRILRQLLFLTCLCWSIGGSAQRRLTVADVETLVPIGGVNVVGSHFTTVSDSTGSFTAPDSTVTLAFSHVNYESRLINLTEVRDTVYLISKLLNLKEVYVFGKGKGDDQLKELRKRLRIDKTEKQLMAADPSQGFNILPLITQLLPKKWRQSAKARRRQQLKEILEEY